MSIKSIHISNYIFYNLEKNSIYFYILNITGLHFNEYRISLTFNTYIDALYKNVPYMYTYKYNPEDSYALKDNIQI